ncbi:MogA/MoaB family molybdenum cofactor biosynthesis protein [Natronorubrum sp. FCH18a]|uniref:MogA/MoaB family molybdenum cofactor biosynthesis protein n=1 Tax=Natronorubrum sp. FCH18a TaxID=3447018 RepID=UPI003F50FEE3
MTETDSSADGETASNATAEDADRPDERSGTDRDSLEAGVVTIATERSLESDAAGEVIVTALKKGGHEVAMREHIGTDHDRVQSIVSRMIDRDDIDIIITGGATGVEPDDVTIEAVKPLIDKELSAFDELFTILAYEAIGTRVVAARTFAGVAAGIPVFCLPGNEGAARLGIEEIVLPEAGTLVGLAREEIDEARWGVDDESAVTDADEAESETGERGDDGDESDSEDGGE